MLASIQKVAVVVIKSEVAEAQQEFVLATRGRLSVPELRIYEIKIVQQNF